MDALQVPALGDAQLNQARADKLREASKLIESVIETLDGGRKRCPCCELEVLRNRDEGRAIEQLAGTVEKLGRIAGSFDARGRRV